MANLTLAGIVISGEFIVLFGATVRAFGAETRLAKERGDDIRRAVAGYEADTLGKIGELYDAVRRRKRLTERVSDALFRSDWSDELHDVLESASRVDKPELTRERLVRAWTALAWILVAAHIAAPAWLIDNIAGQELFPSSVEVGAGLFFGIAAALSLGAAWVVRRFERAFEHVVQGGLDLG